MQALNYRLNNCSSSGFADTLVQLEYAYTKQYKETVQNERLLLALFNCQLGRPTKTRQPALVHRVSSSDLRVIALQLIGTAMLLPAVI